MLTFRADKSAPSGDVVTLAFDGPSPSAFDGMQVNNMVMEKAAAYGFGNCGNSFLPDITPIDEETDEPMTPDAKGQLSGKLKGYRAYFKLRRRV